MQMCFCCNSRNSQLYDMRKPHNHDGMIEIYSEMVAECFGIETKFQSESNYSHLFVICKSCIVELRDAFHLRNQLHDAYERIKDKMNRLTDIEISTVAIKNEINIDHNEESLGHFVQVNIKKESIDRDDTHISERKFNPTFQMKKES